MFAECDSPPLIEIYSSCDLKVRLFYDLFGEWWENGPFILGNHTSI